MLIIPITLVVYNALRRWQEHHVFRVTTSTPSPTGEASGATCSLYQALSSSASLRGYAQYLIGAGRRWK